MKTKSLNLEHLVRPAASSDKPAPALFMLHGYGSNEEDLFSFANDLPEDLCILSLQAPYDLEPFGHAWYAIDFSAERGKWNDIEQAVKSREAVMKFIASAIPAYGLDAGRVNLLGFSQGTILSYALALSYPANFKNVVGLSGYIVPEMLVPDYKDKDHSHLQVYASHGQLDMVIPPAWAQQVPGFLDALQIDNTFEEFPVGHGVSPDNFRSFRKWLTGRY
ncbi:alpha/beta hydrolase [Robiginitalea sp. SC105]|uniref:alpha/beta hydrolase n=1 Tax=Robiginitalea sp. SC105 TaxID=2762332 RepID=UPI00163B2257|nr:phospholipase [Robiginitalea sp. SC105]MBC2840659.1 phospholipase [Robiginitalea sp. SC105]